MADFRDVDQSELRLPPSRQQGADPAKLQRQISLFGRSADVMPAPWVYEGTEGTLVVHNGVTRATRIAKISPGTLIRVEVIGKLPRACCQLQNWRHAVMNSDIQREALTLLAEVWALSPDIRLGQLMAHLGFLGKSHVDHDLSDIEDDELMDILARHKSELEARLKGSSNAILPSTGPAVSTSGSPIGFETA